MHAGEILTSADTKPPRSLSLSTAARLAASFFLLIGAALKYRQILTGNVESFLQFQSLLAGWELTLGLWLAWGFCWRAVTYAAVVTFAGFAGVSLAKALGGEKSCGCLGEIESNPWMTAVLDVSILLLLARVRTKPSAIPRRIGAAASLVWLLSFVALLWFGGGDREKTLGDVLPAELRQGTWEVTVVRSGCLACMAHLREHRTRTRSAAAKQALLTLGEPEPWLEEFYDLFHSHYSVSSENSPKIKTPQKVWIAEGVIVRSSSQGQDHVR